MWPKAVKRSVLFQEQNLAQHVGQAYRSAPFGAIIALKVMRNRENANLTRHPDAADLNLERNPNPRGKAAFAGGHFPEPTTQSFKSRFAAANHMLNGCTKCV